MISFDTVTSYISISVLSNNSNRRILNDEIKFHATHLSFIIFDDDKNLFKMKWLLKLHRFSFYTKKVNYL